ncbi:hypothetical protein FOA52_003427 [Chlamydomonas sp. UWO 241]|nr:hypothetical protein FOA52_003427 [Chlamydomonas sp. UWO 241]
MCCLSRLASWAAVDTQALHLLHQYSTGCSGILAAVARATLSPPAYPGGEKYPEEEELVLGWQPEWGARQAVAVHVEVEGAPCSKAASVQERKSAAMLAAVLEIESYNLHCSAAVSTEPVSSLGAAALPQASTKEGQPLEKCTGAGGKAETKRSVHVLLRAAGALGRAIKGCFVRS